MEKEDAMTILKHIEKILKAIPLIFKDNEKLNKKYGIDTSSFINPFDKKVIKRFYEKNAEEEKLKKYLEALNYETLLKIEAVLYFGREKENDINEIILELAELNEPKNDIIDTIIEKIYACERYFPRAIAKAKKLGIDLNNLHLPKIKK